MTDTNGIFVFTKLQANERYSFSFSHIGYEGQTLKSLLLKEGDNNSIMIKLGPSRNAKLNEVIVVGYGTQKR